MKIPVAGTGYVGLVTAVCLADIGHEVTCIDVEENKIAMLQAGKSPIFANGLMELMLKINPFDICVRFWRKWLIRT